MKVATRDIGPGYPPYMIAELSGNHNGEIDRAFRLMDAAKEAGADAVKIQTYTADTITIDSDAEDFRIQQGPWANRTLYELYQEAHTPWDWHSRLIEKGRSLGLPVIGTPFDPTAVSFLNGLGIAAYKIASFEIVDLDLIRQTARTGGPMIISTGMADIGEINSAVSAARSADCTDLALLHCVSAYPASPKEANLRSIRNLAELFEIVVGLSDHTLGSAVSVAAVALGASIIEKHLTLARADGGPDATFSMEPAEFRRLVCECRDAWDAIGSVKRGPSAGEQENMIFRRSLYVVQDIRLGELITRENVRSIRPGFGMKPAYLTEVIGRRVRCDVKRGTPLNWSLID